MDASFAAGLKKARARHEAGEKIRVGFGVIFDGVFPMAPVFEAMLKDDFFDPFLAVIPDTSRGPEHERKQYDQTRQALARFYPGARLLAPRDEATGKYLPVESECDLWCSANPYDRMTDANYRFARFRSLGLPTFFANYGLTVSKRYVGELSRKSGIFSDIWRVYAPNAFEYWLLLRGRPKESCVLSGYPKMDELAASEIRPRKRKRVIIAPHHTVNRAKGDVNFSNFLRYSSFFHSLPGKYPEIDFVFRPHPLLFPTLVVDNIASQEECDDYLAKMAAWPNMEVQLGGPYIDTFANSDAIIHDCGSFIGEWLYTGKPGCYLLKDGALAEYNEFARECLLPYELAESAKDILKFIEDTVMRGQDTKGKLRSEYLKKVRCNHPNATRTVVNDLKRIIRKI